MTPTLTEFLLACIAEDERDADQVHERGCSIEQRFGDCDCGYPARVLADCEAKRQIVSRYAELTADARNLDDHGTNGEIIGLRFAVQSLAATYADRPDYRAEWRP